MSSSSVGFAGRYATALYELADAQNNLDQVASDLSDFQGLIQENGDLQRLLRSPVLSREEQAAAMEAILEKAGANELTNNFIGVVVQNRRLFGLSNIIKSFLGLIAEKRGEATAEVVSAKELTDKQVKDLSASLKKAVGSDVAVETSVDPDLLGGLVVKVGSRMVDNSLKTKLQQLRLAMKGVA